MIDPGDFRAQLASLHTQIAHLHQRLEASLERFTASVAVLAPTSDLFIFAIQQPVRAEGLAMSGQDGDPPSKDGNGGNGERRREHAEQPNRDGWPPRRSGRSGRLPAKSMRTAA